MVYGKSPLFNVLIFIKKKRHYWLTDAFSPFSYLGDELELFYLDSDLITLEIMAHIYKMTGKGWEISVDIHQNKRVWALDMLGYMMER